MSRARAKTQTLRTVCGGAVLAAALAAIAAPTPGSADVRLFARECAALENSPQKTIRFCTRALETQRLGAKPQAQVLVNRAVAFSALDRPDAALADYDQAAALYPWLFETWPNRGRTLLRLGRPLDAFESFERALSLRPNDTPSKIGRAAALIAGGAPDRALEDLDAVLVEEPRNATALYNRGVANMALGRLYDAGLDFSDVIAIEPNDVDARLKRGRLREAPWRDGALDDYAAAIAIAPDDPRPYFQRGRFLDSLGEAARADQDFRRAWELGMRGEWLHERIISLGG